MARDDAGVRAVIRTSAVDNVFSAGMDLAMIRRGNGLDLRRFLEKLYFEMHDLQYRMGKPTIAALTGPARAAGVTLAVSCDVLIASERSEEHTSELQSLMRISYAVFCLNKKIPNTKNIAPLNINAAEHK